MSSSVTIVDYGSGNLFSVQRALEYVGARVRLANNADDIFSAARLILPGVGAFEDGMQGLREKGLIEPLQGYAATGRPLLGICLGMQMLANSSAEFGRHEGLGLIPGNVIPIPSFTVDDLPQKIPHIGWADLILTGNSDWQDTLLDGTSSRCSMYLIHSFHFCPDNSSDLKAVYCYGGHMITAAVQRNNVIGCQFHPEKSSKAGLGLLSRFMAL